MPSLEVDVLAEAATTATVVEDSTLSIEIDLGDVLTMGTAVTEVEVAEVQLPESIGIENMVRNAGSVPGIMKLGATDPVPPGTPAGTVILREE
jgi:hypothetical protein